MRVSTEEDFGRTFDGWPYQSNIASEALLLTNIKVRKSLQVDQT